MDQVFQKGGEDWGRISIDRRSKGIEVWAQLDKKVEELMQSASEGQGSYTTALESFGRNWIGMDPTPSIKVYTLERSLDSTQFFISQPCGPLKDPKTGRTNLSFLTFQGIGSPNGVRFMILGPAMGDFLKDYGKNVVRDVTNFLREYLVPVHIGISLHMSDKF